MEIVVKSFGMVRSALGHKELTLTLSQGATVRDAIDRLIDMTGSEARAVLLSSDGTSLKVRAVVNGKALLLDSPLEDGVELNLLLTIGGGAFPPLASEKSVICFM